MPNRAQFRLTLAMLVGWTAASALFRLWAARHANDDGISGTTAGAVNAAI